MSDDLFELAGLTQTTPSHWTPIVRTRDFEAEQKATRARLAETYEPGRSERSMLYGDPLSAPAIDWGQLHVHMAATVDAFVKSIQAAVTAVEDLFEPWHATWAEPSGLRGIETAFEVFDEPCYAAMSARDRALTMKNDRARVKGIEGTKKARRRASSGDRNPT